MKTNEMIHVNTSYTRSINVERDSYSQSVLASYIPTSRAVSTLSRLLDTLNTNASPRSWALIGPYGSGKSAFSLFLSHLLGGKSDPLFQTAIDKLGNREAALQQAFHEKLHEKGYFHVLITGSPESLSQKIIKGLKESIESSSLDLGVRQVILARLSKLLLQESIAGSEIIDEFRNLQSHLKFVGFNGVLLVIDELGKFLEYEARNPKSNEIHLLQLLAEHAAQANDAPMQLVVLMHQAFELYARNVRETLKNEWQKVQGRFETIPFIESTEQSMRILSIAIEQQLPASLAAKVAQDAQAMAAVLVSEGALPNTFSQAEAAELFAQCYPLHPLSLLTLPTLCQKIAQNERTLFSYLGSAEPHGFVDALSRLVISEDRVDWIQPWEVYEYFIQNQSTSVLEGSTRRRWNEVGAALDRLGSGLPAEEMLLKTIGLLNIIGVQGGLKPSEVILDLLDCTHAGQLQSSKQLLAKLLDKSLITFRKFSGEYRVWQGSDFDFDVALKTALAEHGRVDLVQRLNSHRKAEPVVARRYTIETGTLRFFKPVFVEASDLNQLPPANEPEIVYVLATQSVDSEALEAQIQKFSLEETLRIYAIVDISEDIYSIVSELAAIKNIQATNPLLVNDPIALRELNERQEQTQLLEEMQLNDLLDQPKRLKWYRTGHQLNLKSQRELQECLTGVLSNDIYPKAPHIFNELINRNSPSATANSAKKKLLVAMLENPEQEDLGFDKYPAEKAMYLALLKATGIHRPNPDTCGWGFFAPLDDDEFKISAVWNHIIDFFKRADKHPEPVSALYAELGASPFGIKDGVKPILFFAAYLANQNEVAVFDQGVFSGVFTLEMLEKLLKDPSNIKVQNASLDGMRMEVFKQYSSEILKGKNAGESILPVAKVVARIMKDLPEYTQKTKQLSPEAQAIRTLFIKAESPGDLLFRALPQACGFEPDALITPELAQQYVKQLKEKLTELQLAYSKMLGVVSQRLSDAFGYSIELALPELRKTLQGRATGLENFTVDTGGLKAFVLRLQESHGDDDLWLERVAAFLAKKPANKWLDSDLQLLELRLSDLVRSFDDLEKLRHAHGEHTLVDETDFEVVLLHTMRAQSPEKKEFIRIRKPRMQQLQKHQADIREILTALPDREAKLAVLASLLEEALDSSN